MKKSNFILLIAIATLTTFSHCKKDEKEDPKPPVYTNGQGEIGNIGGTVRIDDPQSPIHGASVFIPDGALSTKKLISIEIAPENIQFPADTNLILVSFKPQGLVFNKPILITLPYFGTDTSNAVAYHYDDINDVITQMPVVEVDDKNVIFETNHFSYYVACEYKMVMHMKMIYCNAEGRIGAKVKIHGWSIPHLGAPIFYPGLQMIPVRIKYWLNYGMTAKWVVKDFPNEVYSIFSVHLFDDSFFLPEKAKITLVVGRSKSSDSYIAWVIKENPNGIAYETETMVYEGEHQLEEWMKGDPLIFYFDDFVFNPSRKYWVKAEWKLAENPNGSSRITTTYKLNNKKDRKTPGQMELISKESIFENCIDADYITSQTPPISAFTATPTSGTAPLTVNFTDQSTNNPTSWAWDFGDGNTSSLQNPTHTYQNQGNYSVQLTVNNAHGSNAELKTNFVNVFSGGGSVDLLNGLISYWELDENSGAMANDVAGNWNLTLINEPTWTSNGKINNAIDFGVKSNRYLEKTGVSSGNLNTYTLSAWVYLKDNSADHKKIMGLNSGVSAYNAGAAEVKIMIEENDKFMLKYHTNDGAGPSGIMHRISGTSIQLNTWYHLVGVVNNGQVYLYINGIEDNTNQTQNSSNSNLNFSNGRVSVGNARLWGGNYVDYRWFRGIIDEAAIWNRALNANEVSELYNYGNGLQYPFDGSITIYPAAPTNVYAGDWYYQGFGVYWTDNSDNETGFRIYKATNSLTNLQEYGTTPDNATFFADNQNNPDNYYAYKVTAFNNDGESEMSNPAVIPKRPISLSGQAGANAITLNWAYPSDSQAERVYIERSTSQTSGFMPIGYEWHPNTSYEDNNAEQGVDYYYRVHSSWGFSGVDHNCKSLPTDVIGPLRIGSGGGTPCPGTPTVTDIDGNIYNTVLIGDQCWMKENLNTTRDAAGNNITRYCYWNNVADCELYGGLYTWHTVMNGAGSSNSNPSGVQGICPTGWHIPSDSECSQLVEYVVAQAFTYGNALKSCRQINSPLGGDCNTTEHPRWEEDTYSGNNHHGFDEFGFSALPAGYRLIDGNFDYIGTADYRWSSTEYFSLVRVYALYWNSNSLFVFELDMDKAFSLRCIKD